MRLKSPSPVRTGSRTVRKGRRRSGPSPAESLLPQIRERERRKRYKSGHDLEKAPNKLIGCVSAGGLELPDAAPVLPQRRRGGRSIIALLTFALVLIWLRYGGLSALMAL